MSTLLNLSAVGTMRYPAFMTCSNSTADFFSTVLTPRRPQDFQNINADKSSSALDHRHRISIATYYDVPYFKTGNWLRRNVLGNWLLAPIYRSGRRTRRCAERRRRQSERRLGWRSHHL